MVSPLAQLREKFRLKKEDLALLLGISVPTLNRIEGGITKIPEKCFTGLKALNQDPEEIVEQQLLFIEDKKQKILKSLRFGND